MLDDTLGRSTAVATPATVARLRLQLRAARREADAAEAASTGLSKETVAAAVAELQSRLTPLMEERRQAFAAELVRAGGDALDAIADARLRAAQLVVLFMPTTAASVPNPIAASSLPGDLHVSAPKQRQSETPQAHTLPPPPPPMSMSASLMPTTPAPPVVLDAEVFARVFVTMLVDALEARGRQIHPQSIVVAAPIAAPAVVKQGFWTHARHVDVLLLGLTMAIVLVILAAWLV